MTLALVPVLDGLPAGFDRLRDAARAEGYSHMERLAADWASGANRFDAPGEALLAAVMAGALAGIGGMSVDPADPTALRMRRFYVEPGFRRDGIGRCLATALMARARQFAGCLVLNAETGLAVRFWEALGFVPDRRDGHTHMLRWPMG